MGPGDQSTFQVMISREEKNVVIFWKLLLFVFSAEMREVKNNAWYDNRYKRSKLVEFKQSYTIRGLTHGSRYKVSRFVGFTYFSLKTFSKTLQTF